MKKQSAGILMYKRTRAGLCVLLVHPGGPFWAKKDLHAWSIPKGEYERGDDPLTTAKREFQEELGCQPAGEFRALGEIVQAGGKTVVAWTVEGDFDPAALVSDSFEMEWPPRSGRRQSFPEVDRAAWFTLAQAREKIVAGQRALIDRLLEQIEDKPNAPR